MQSDPGLTFPNSDLDALAAALAVGLRSEETERFSGGAARDHLARHSIGVVARRYLELFEELR